MLQWYQGPPGVQAAVSTANRILFLNRSEIFLPGGRLIDGSKARDTGNTADLGVLRPGLLMGKITTGGKYAPAVIGITSGAYTSGGTSLTVSLAQAVELVRRIGASGTGYVIGPPTANGVVATTALTYSAVDVTTGIITCTSLGVNKVAGSFVCADDGSQVPITFIPDQFAGGGAGIQVVDAFGASVSSVDFPALPIWGIVDATQFLPAWPTDTSLQAYITSNLSSSGGGKYTFSGNF